MSDEPNDTEVVGTDFSSRGMTHKLEVVPNENHTGWVFFATSFSGSGSANISQKEAEKLAKMLLAGPGEVKYDCVEHQKIGMCIECLL